MVAKTPRKARRFPARFLLLAVVLAAYAVSLAYAQTASGSTSILSRDLAGPLLPATVFYDGQVARIQARNSAGIHFADSKLVLVALVDTSGYASSVQQTYQGYLITEITLQFGDKTLPPGAYGFGFVSGNRVVVMDLGGNEVLSTSTIRDAQLSRPTPLQILSDGYVAGRFRLYVGRSYVTLQAAK